MLRKKKTFDVETYWNMKINKKINLFHVNFTNIGYFIVCVSATWAKIKHVFCLFRVNIADDDEDPYFVSLRKCLILGITYSANIGGIGTLTGAASNMIMVGSLEK